MGPHRQLPVTTPFARAAGLLLMCGLLCSSPAFGASACRKVTGTEKAEISQAALTDLAHIGIMRPHIFASIIQVSLPETQGCWAGATGNFDKQVMSIGVAQWNLGQKSLQPLLRSYMVKFGSEVRFRAELQRLMPVHGTLVFSEGCLRKNITADCRDKLLALQSPGGRLLDAFKTELDALFESDAMIQAQVDAFVRILTSVRSDLGRLFPGRPPTSREIKWAIDTAVQQGSFPGDVDIKRVRERLTGLDPTQKKEKLLSLVLWYEGLCSSLDQDGVRLDWKWNVDQWRLRIKSTQISDEQVDLLHLSHLRSRVASTDSGLWQALTFQRRTKVVLGVGSVSGRRDGP